MINKTILTIVSVLILVTASSLAILSNTQEDASAAVARDFKPGRIIDDAVFYNNGSMNASQIQNFLNSKVPSCDTNGTGRATDWGRGDITRAKFAEGKRNGTIQPRDTGFHAPPYTCLRDFRQNTPQMAPASGLCEGISAKSNRSAAQIIKDVADACGINPQVLIVLLEKEQSLVTDIWPLQRQFRSATGFACPDTAPCNPEFNGFFYQVYYAARQFNVYKSQPNSYNYKAGQTNKVYWQTNLGEFVNPTGNANDPSRNGRSACGHSNIRIENQATAALYIYTPYRPNQAAMNNLYGTGDGCSAYGNRNFWRIFTDWFGSTHDIYNYRHEVLLSDYNESSVIINPDVKVGNSIQTLTIGDEIYTFYHDTKNKTLRYLHYKDQSWSDHLIDGYGSDIRGSVDHDVGAHNIVAFNRNGKPQVYYLSSTERSLRHAWINNNSEWRIETLDGSLNSISGQGINIGSAIEGFTRGDVGIQLYYQNSSDNSLRHAWWDGSRWRFETLDGSLNSVLGNVANMGSSIRAVEYNGGIQLFYHNSSDRQLHHAWWRPEHGWKHEVMDGSIDSVLGNNINAGSHIDMINHNNNLFVAYYDNSQGFSDDRTSSWRMIYWDGSRWIQKTLDGSLNSVTGIQSVLPESTLTMRSFSNGTVQIFYRSVESNMMHMWVR